MPPAVSPAVSPATPPAAAWAHRLPGRSGAGSGISPVRRVLTHGNRRAGQPPVPAPHGTAHPTAPAARPSGTVPSRARCPAVLPVPRPGCPMLAATAQSCAGHTQKGRACRGALAPPLSPGAAPQSTGSPSAAAAQPPPCPQAPPHTGTGTALRDICKRSAAPHVPWAPQSSSTSYCTSTPHCPPHSLGTPLQPQVPRALLSSV